MTEMGFIFYEKILCKCIYWWARSDFSILGNELENVNSPVSNLANYIDDENLKNWTQLQNFPKNFTLLENR